MNFSQPQANFYAPQGQDPSKALASTTHMGIGAHADDLEILAFPGIASCFQDPKKHFSGIVVTDGSGAPRTGRFSSTPDTQLIPIRQKEQRAAADLGKYASVIQLAHPSSAVRQADRSQVVAELTQILEIARRGFEKSTCLGPAQGGVRM